jgi:hypothetical protein
MDPFIDQIVAMSDIPKFILLGTAQEAKASTPALLKIIEPALKPSKDKLKLFFEEQILKPLMEANHISTVPQLIIGDVQLTEEQETEKIEREKQIKETEDKKIEKTTLSLAQITADKETKIIKENKKKPAAKRKHKFKAAVWTHPNGHPRCLICGDEEPIGGYCPRPGKETLSEKNKEKDRQAKVREKTNKKLKERKANDYNQIGIKKSELLFTGTYASELINQERKQLVFSKKEKRKLTKNINKKMDLIENGKLLGKIKLRKPRKININDFTQLEYAHLISPEEREKRWPCETEFYVYEFDIIKEKGRA